MGRFEFLELLEREQNGWDPTASVSYRVRPLRDLFTLSAATIRARDELLSKSAVVWEIVDRLRDALGLFDDGIEEPRMGASPSRSLVGSSSSETMIAKRWWCD
jgi:hypothetical protein